MKLEFLPGRPRTCQHPGLSIEVLSMIMQGSCSPTAWQKAVARGCNNCIHIGFSMQSMIHYVSSRWILTARFKIQFFEFQNKIFKSLMWQMFDMISNSVPSYIDLFLPSACTYIIISYSIKWFNEHFSLYFSMRKWKGIWQKNQIFKIHFFGFSNKILKWLQNDIVTVLFYPIGKWLSLQVCIHVSLSRSLS